MSHGPRCACDACAQARRERISTAKARYYSQFYDVHPEARPIGDMQATIIPDEREVLMDDEAHLSERLALVRQRLGELA